MTYYGLRQTNLIPSDTVSAAIQPDKQNLAVPRYAHSTFHTDFCYFDMIRTIGYILLAISFLSFISILIVPWVGFTKVQIAGITTGLIIVGEVLFYLSLFILGKSFWSKIKSKLRFRKVKINDHNPQNLTDTDQQNFG